MWCVRLCSVQCLCNRSTRADQKMGASLKATANIDAVFDDLSSKFAAVRDVAIPRTINKVADQAQTAGLRKINDLYKIGPRTMEQYVANTIAIAGRLEATITVKGKGFPLYLFDPRQTKAGVSVSVKGRRFIIPGTFIATMPNGHTGIFARGAYGGKGANFRSAVRTFGRFSFGKGRLPINELYTLSPPDAFGNPEVVQAMQDRVDQQLPVVLQQEISFAVR